VDNGFPRRDGGDRGGAFHAPPESSISFSLRGKIRPAANDNTPLSGWPLRRGAILIGLAAAVLALAAVIALS
jgi:hypothetical protein